MTTSQDNKLARFALLVLVAVLLAPSSVLAQTETVSNREVVASQDEASTTQTQSVAGWARPKLRYHGHFRLETSDGAYRFTLYYYFEQGGNFSKLDSHVFYPSPYHLVVKEGDKKIKNHFDENDGILTLWIRQPTTFERIEKDLRHELATVAIEKHSITIMKGTEPYRISVLPLTSAVLELTKSKKRSDKIEGAGLQEGDIAVHFGNLSRPEAEKIVTDLENDVTQLLFRYTFSGVSDETCTATFEGRGVQDIDLFKKVKGKGGTGFVARHQVVDIADQLVAQEIFKIRCAEGGLLANLAEILMNRLEKREKRTVASWDELDKLIAFDVDSFTADVTEELDTIENNVDRQQALEALSNATSGAKSEALEGGIAVGYGPFMAKAEASYAKANAEAQSEAQKAFTDALEKRGLSVQWAGWKSKPKTVDVHSVADLDAKWARDLVFEYSIPKGQEGREALRMTANDRTAIMPGQMRRNIEHRVLQLEEAMISLSDRLKVEEAATSDISGRLPEGNFRWSLNADDQSITLQTSDPQEKIFIEAGPPRSPDPDASYNVYINASDDVNVRADDDVKIRANDFVSIRGKGVPQRGSRNRMGGDVDIRANDDVDIRANDDVDIRADETVDILAKRKVRIRGRKIYLNDERHISINRCRYYFERLDSEWNEHHFYSTLGRSDDEIAIVSGFSRECDDGSSPEIRVTRKSSSDNDWLLHVRNWRDCRYLYVDVVFMKGFGVAWDSWQDTIDGDQVPLSRTNKWGRCTGEG